MAVSSDHLSEEELVLQLELAGKKVKVGSFYHHYRDPEGRYKVIGLGIIESTQEPGVLYQKEYGSDHLKSVVWIRPLSSWLEEVDLNGTRVPRFQEVREQASTVKF